MHTPVNAILLLLSTPIQCIQVDIKQPNPPINHTPRQWQATPTGDRPRPPVASGHAHQSVAVCIIYIASHTPAHVRCLSCLVLIVLEITWGQFLHIVIIHTDCTPENIHVTPSTPTGLYSTFHLIIIHATHFLYPWKQSNYGPAATCRHQVCVQAT